jgi:hypothetical protein
MHYKTGDRVQFRDRFDRSRGAFALNIDSFGVAGSLP